MSPSPALGAADLVVIGGEGDDVRAEVLPPVGARLHRVTAFGHEVLRAAPALDAHRRDPFLWGAFPMVPWCNRVPGGRIVFGDEVVDVATNHVDAGRRSAIHGLAADRPWHVAGEGAFAFAGGDELPWPWSVRQDVAVEGAVLRWAMTVRNEGDRPMPAGAGLHPWFTSAGGLSVRLAADLVYPRVGMIPSSDPRPVAGPTDLRAGGPPPWGLDDVFTGLGTPAAELVWREHDLRAELEVGGAVTHITVAAFPAMGAVAVEPQSHATDGHRRLRDGEPGAVDVVAPGEELRVTATLRFSRLGPAT